jgi:hypothetical protein
VKTLDIPYPHLLIFCGIGFSVLLAIPPLVNVTKGVEKPGKLYKFYEKAGKPLFIFGISYIVGAFVDLLYFPLQNTEIGLWSFKIIVGTTFLVIIFLVCIGLITYIEERIERIVEKKLLKKA